MAGAAYGWTRGSPMLPASGQGPFPRLYEDVQRAYSEAARRCWEAVGSPMAREYIVEFVDGWPYRRGPDTDDAARRRLDAHHDHVYALPDGAGSYYFDELRPQVVEIIERLRRHPRPSRPRAELVAHLQECTEAHGHIMGDLHWRLAAGAMREGFEWPQTYAEITGRPAEEAFVFVICLSNPLTRTIKQLRRLARVAASDRELAAAVERGDTSALAKFPAFRSAFHRLLRRDGHRNGSGWGATVTTGGPTWSVRPDIPLKLIATYMHSDMDGAEGKERSLRRRRDRVLRSIRRELDAERLGRFERALRAAGSDAVWMEDHNYWMDQAALGIVREAAHVVGVALVREGVVDDPEDVVHFSLDDLRTIGGDARAVVRSRRDELARRASMDPPKYRGAITGGRAGPPESKTGGRDGNVLRGEAVSGGRYTGVARVRMPSPVLPDVAGGDVLVAVNTGPDWTPLFGVLGAVVLDEGASWQHAAVMAREFQIPAVIGTVEATSVIKDGQTVTVDGDAGVVRLSD